MKNINARIENFCDNWNENENYSSKQNNDQVTLNCLEYINIIAKYLWFLSLQIYFVQ